MDSLNFCYWLRGWIELNKTIDCREGATKETIQAIEDHLDLVFKKVTPERVVGPVTSTPFPLPAPVTPGTIKMEPWTIPSIGQPPAITC